MKLKHILKTTCHWCTLQGSKGMVSNTDLFTEYIRDMWTIAIEHELKVWWCAHTLSSATFDFNKTGIFFKGTSL